MVHFVTIPVKLNGQQSTVSSNLLVAFSFQNNVCLNCYYQLGFQTGIFSGKSISLGIKMKVFYITSTLLLPLLWLCGSLCYPLLLICAAFCYVSYIMRHRFLYCNGLPHHLHGFCIVLYDALFHHSICLCILTKSNPDHNIAQYNRCFCSINCY